MSPSNADKIRGYYEAWNAGGFDGALHDTLGDVRYKPLDVDSLGDDLAVIRTKLVGTPRGSSVPLSQELGIVCELEDGLVRRMVAFGSHAQAREVAQGMARA